MDVIGAGFGRTGTLSLKAALEQLGFGPCYHMYELLGHVERAPAWNAADQGDVGALRVALDGYRATVDWPGCVFWRELSALHPDAKVLLSVRPAEQWYASFRETVGMVISRPRPAELPPMIELMFTMSERIVRDRSFGETFALDDAEAVIAAYEAHNQAVRDGVDPDRLLEFDVAQGWDPLCDFLAVPVPDAPFPNVNDREQFKMLFGTEDSRPAPTERDFQQRQVAFRAAARGT